MLRPPASAFLLAAAAALPGGAWALCTSDHVAQPEAVLERFVNADCEACWRDPATPQAGPGVLALDWIVPGSRGEDAPLFMAERREAHDRLQALGRPAPEGADAVMLRRSRLPLPLRIAQGEPVNDYIGTSIVLRPPAAGRWDTWLLLVEALPAGAEGSPVPRNLVRNVFRPEWPARGPWRESRPTQIHEGADVRRLRLVALVQDAGGRMRAIAATQCPPGWPQ